MPELMKLPRVAPLRQRLFAGLRTGMSESAGRSAVVFAPHQDDESLGCGGTIIRKREAGAPVGIVFMTDGAASHRQFLGEDEIRGTREEEALRAAEKLGVDESDVRFLGYPDGRLGDCHDLAVRRVREILERARPEEVFIPFRNDGTADHEATYRIVVEALEALPGAVDVYEYPVWFWNQWPWVSLQFGFGRQSIKTFRHVVGSGCGASFFRSFRDGFFVGDVLDKKRQALGEHRSQMSRPVSEADWPILSDVSGGEFLECFFQEFEVFHRWKTNADMPRLSARGNRSSLAADGSIREEVEENARVVRRMER